MSDIIIGYEHEVISTVNKEYITLHKQNYGFRNSCYFRKFKGDILRLNAAVFLVDSYYIHYSQ